MKRNFMKKTGAYFTVEATLVLPMVMGVILFVIYLLFFRYDRCLMEQDAAVLAMRGCTLQITDREEMAQELFNESVQTDRTRYLAFSTDEAQITLKGNSVTVKQGGRLEFPFEGVFLDIGSDEWETGICVTDHRISPVNFIRNCRKIMGGK